MGYEGVEIEAAGGFLIYERISKLWKTKLRGGF